MAPVGHIALAVPATRAFWGFRQWFWKSCFRGLFSWELAVIREALPAPVLTLFNRGGRSSCGICVCSCLCSAFFFFVCVSDGSSGSTGLERSQDRSAAAAKGHGQHGGSRESPQTGRLVCGLCCMMVLFCLSCSLDLRRLG